MSERAGDPKKARGFGRRKILCLLLALTLLCAACGQAPQAQIQQLRSDDFTAALERDEIRSVLVIGDSISDGNGDVGCLYDQQERARAGNRLILTDEAGNAYYENAADAQGWVTDFRAYLAKNSAVLVFHNAAISGKSAKWFNAHKEALFSGGNDRYDAIFVMLGTNDRSDCQSGGEFQAEYGSLLDYLKDRCDHLTVLVPIPAIYDPTDTAKHLTSRQIAEQVIALCQEQGYRYIDCYHGLPQYAADCGTPLGTLYWGGTHPNAAGYEALWQVIAREPEGAAQPEPVEEITCIGCNLPQPAGDTPADALTSDGTPVYPPGTSWYYTWNDFTAALPHGAFIETHRGSDGAAVQYARSTQYHKTTFAYIRTWQDGAWSGWSDI